jgi:hypothetical protein
MFAEELSFPKIISARSNDAVPDRIGTAAIVPCRWTVRGPEPRPMPAQDRGRLNDPGQPKQARPQPVIHARDRCPAAKDAAACRLKAMLSS